MDGGFGGSGGFDSKGSVSDNVNSYYKYTHSGGGGNGGNNKGCGCGTYIFIIFILLLVLNEFYKCSG